MSVKATYPGSAGDPNLCVSACVRACVCVRVRLRVRVWEFSASKLKCSLIAIWYSLWICHCIGIEYITHCTLIINQSLKLPLFLIVGYKNTWFFGHIDIKSLSLNAIVISSYKKWSSCHLWSIKYLEKINI